LPALDVPATGFPSGLFSINSYRDPEAESRDVNDAPQAAHGVAYSSGFLDDFGRYTATSATQHESLQRGTIPQLSHAGR
jgi:hypothetical protein